MSTRPNKMQRLVRLNQFREELANGVLRQAIHEQNVATEKHETAVSAIEKLEQWKALKQADGGLDIGLYNAALEHEQHAMQLASTLKTALTEAEQSTQKAQKKMVDAASTTKVSEQRESRQKKQAELENEKRSFDQISDVWLNNRERAHD
ncbi:MAG: hypothetical protein ACREO1_06775 [Arenimonas sp.]